MRNKLTKITCCLLLCTCSFLGKKEALHAQEIKHTIAANGWNTDSLGNHRALVQFNGKGTVAKVNIEWRRRDSSPQDKRIIIQDAQTKQRIQNVQALTINRENGIICFEPLSGKGTYYVYYLPYKNEGRSNYPRGKYLVPDTTASPSWLASFKAAALPLNAVCTEIQSTDALNSFYPMEIIATANETNRLKNQHVQNAFLVFPEDREHAIRMKDDLPKRWIQQGADKGFAGIAAKGEHFTFQLGVYALQDIQNLQVSFSNLRDAKGNIIPASLLSCINTNGTRYDGTALINTVSVDANKVQALWCAVTIPGSITAGKYTGIATVTAAGTPVKNIAIALTISNQLKQDGGISEPWKLTRLHWLNSTLAQDNTVIAPYTPLQVQGNTISLLGRKIVLTANGLPEQIQTYFTEEMTGYTTQPNNVLAAPVQFNFVAAKEQQQAVWKPRGLQFTKLEPGTVQWHALNTSDALEMDVHASLEFDGFIAYTVKVTALQDIDLADIALQIPFQQQAAKYMMGLGQKGGERPDTLKWKWEVASKNQDGAWIGNVNAGLQYSLRDEKYVRPLNTNFYLQKPLLLPASWGNGSKGGIDISTSNGIVLANNYSGERSLKKGDVLFYNFNLLITPFHPINTEFQWQNRFYHKYNNLDTIQSTGATVVNIHHATPINPWINYPFIEWKKMKSYLDSAHHLGLKVKIYNTVRELSNHAYETFALRSLGHEVYSPGKGGGFSWLQEHIGDDYIAAWFVPEIKDAAIVNSGMNRWHNYYVEGMNWLTQQVGIDGIYLDDVAFDRVTMKRIKRVLTKDNHPGIIDLHSANQYNKSDGFNNSAMLYMEHFPYLNRLWFGEYFDYEKNSPDFFLTEVSGIPFGLMGEMLENDGNLWRGMVYGMTNRLGWSDKSDPKPIWKFWDEMGIKGTEMMGYWSSRCPVKTNNSKVLATVYQKKGLALVSIASWADTTVNIRLQVNWKQLGIDPAKATITAPAVNNFQPAKQFAADEEIPVEKNKGWLLVIKEN